MRLLAADEEVNSSQEIKKTCFDCLKDTKFSLGIVENFNSDH